MEFKKVIKRIVALGVGASMVGATIFGAMAADLAQYPNQFIKDGKFTGVLVVGDKAAAEDVIGVSDIAVSLQFAATKPVTVTSTGGVSAEGEAWQVQKGITNVLEMSENPHATATSESIATITSSSYIDDAELPVLLASGAASNSKGDAPYQQRLYFEDATTAYVQYMEDRNDVTGDFLYFQNGKQIARYELEFTASLESDVDDSAGAASATGDYLTDFDDVEIAMLGKTYSIVTARRNGAGTTGQVILTLMGGAVKDTLLEGATKTYTLDGKDYEVTLEYVDLDEAKFTVNAQSTRKLKDGETDKTSDGTTVGVSEILYQDYAGGVHSATFFLGAQKLWLKDTNSNTSVYSTEIKVDDETIDGATVDIQGSDDSTTFKIDKIIVNMTADDDYYVPAGGKLSENSEMSESELLFTKGWDIEYQGLSNELLEEIAIKTSGSDDYELSFIDGSGNKATIPLINAVGGTAIRFGDTDNDLIVQENKTITKDDYFIITDESGTNGERKSYALRYRGADKLTADSPIISFDDLGSGERIERTLSTPTTQTAMGWGVPQSEVAQIKLGGGIFRVYNVSTASATKDFNILVSLNANATVDNNVVALNTKYGASIAITNSSSLGATVAIDTVNTDDYDNLAPTQISFDVNATSSEVTLTLSDTAHTLLAPEDDDKNTYGYTSYGAFIKRSTPTSAPQEVLIQYPQNQRLPQVFITSEGASFTATTAATTEAVTLQRIDVGATKLASEVPNIKAVNSILVGGPCANAAARIIMGDPADCLTAIDIGPGEGIIKLYENGGNVAMLVAGYNPEDTRKATGIIAKYGDYKAQLKGNAVKVTTATSQVTEFVEAVPVAPVVPVAPEAPATE